MATQLGSSTLGWSIWWLGGCPWSGGSKGVLRGGVELVLLFTWRGFTFKGSLPPFKVGAFFLDSLCI